MGRLTELLHARDELWLDGPDTQTVAEDDSSSIATRRLRPDARSDPFDEPTERQPEAEPLLERLSDVQSPRVRPGRGSPQGPKIGDAIAPEEDMEAGGAWPSPSVDCLTTVAMRRTI